MGIEDCAKSPAVIPSVRQFRALIQGEGKLRIHFLVVWLLVKEKFTEAETIVCFAFECIRVFMFSVVF